ncbi:MAG: ATP-binding cassette domain-containing protein [Hyphomicrobiaceae bacterium]
MRDNLDIPPPMLRPVVLLSGIVVCAGATTILDRITLQISMGLPTAIVGPNGSGKTTLLRVVMGLVAHHAGAIQADVGSRAIVFQKPVMLRRTAAENIAFALRAAGQATDQVAIASLLDQVGLAELADRPARRLSGGEQQRLGIARALARRPRLLLLDEATASLDPAQAKIIEDLIGSIARAGVKVVFATHDLGQARRLAGDIVFLVKGQVAEHAPTDRFFANPASEAARRFLAGELVI